MSARTGRFHHDGTEHGYVVGADLVEVFRTDRGERFARIPLCGTPAGSVDDASARRLHAAWRAGFDAGIPEGRAQKVQELRAALAI